MFRRITIAAMVPTLALLGGCGGTYNGGIESAHQPVVQRTVYALDLDTMGYRLASGESERLSGWLAAIGLRYGDLVAVDGIDGRMGIRDQVAAEAGPYGIAVLEGAPVVQGDVAPGTVRVTVTRAAASVPGCPDHSREYLPDYSASTSSNFGCAVNANLAAMVADPNDLVSGQQAGASNDPATATRAVRTWRNATPTGASPLPTVSTTQRNNQ